MKRVFAGKRVAVKVIEKGPDDSKSESLSSELNAKDLTHENVVQVFGVYPDPSNNSVIIMEYVGKNNLQTLLDAHSEKIDDAFTQR